MVVPDDLDNPAGTITYNGVDYPPFTSFLSTGGNFTVNGECSLRRCWLDAFDWSTEVTDRDHWQGKQKPAWCDFVADDLRCLMRNNNPNSGEMMQDADGNYITSGHTDFYAMINGDSGVPNIPQFVGGKYMQIQLVITTLNPM